MLAIILTVVIKGLVCARYTRPLVMYYVGAKERKVNKMLLVSAHTELTVS